MRVSSWFTSCRSQSLLRSTKQVDKEAIGAGNAFGKFAKKGQACVDVGAFAESRVDEAPGEIGFAGVVHGQQRRVLGIKVAPVVEATFLDPALEIGGSDFVGPFEKAIVGLEESHLAVSSGVPGVGLAEGGVIGCRKDAVPDVVAIVLDNQRPAI